MASGFNGFCRFDAFTRPCYGDVLDEHFKTTVRNEIHYFLQVGRPRVTLGPMTPEQRQFVRSLAKKFNLKTRSSGEEGNRRVTISHWSQNYMFSVPSAAYETESVTLNASIRNSLEEYFSKYPISKRHVDEHRRSGLASRKGREIRNGEKLRLGEPMLIPPASRETEHMRRFRETLPTYGLRSEILKTIRNNKVTLITGGTGCGKTTQVPQFILEEGCFNNTPLRVICTQPRRMPAVAVANRVARERNEKVGDTIGYHIRLEQRTSPQTILTYCTSGVLLRMFTIDGIEQRVSHIILDEIHEREQMTDYLLILLRQAIKERDDLKVILMSATMEGNLDLFLRYFGDVKVAHIDVPSRLHKVQKYFLAEVLTMIDYRPPKSIFGGTFINVFGSEKKKLDRFPLVDEFRCDPIAEKDSSKRFQKMRPLGVGSEMISVKTAPDLSSLSASGGHSSVMAQSCDGCEFNGGHMTAEGSMVSSSSTSALGSLKVFSGNGSERKSDTFGEEIQQLAHKLAAWTETEVTSGVHRPDDHSSQTISVSQPETIFQNGQPHAACQIVAENGDDPVQEAYEYVDAEEEFARRHALEQTVSQQYLTMEMEQLHSHQGGSYRAHFSPDFGGVPPHFSSIPYASPQFAFQRFASPVQPVITQQQLGYTQVRPTSYGLYHPQGPVMFNAPVQAPHHVHHTSPQYGNAHKLYSVSPEVLDGGVPNTPVLNSAFPPNGVRSSQMPPASFVNDFAFKRDKVLHTVRPKSFNPSSVEKLLSKKIDEEDVIEDYLRHGGQQWTDSVDPDLTVAVIKYCLDSPLQGSILVFLPGYDDISKIGEKVANETKDCITKATILTLHSQLNSQDQLKVFDPPAPGHRKVILSTNIAEASLTIDDVVFVIDCGKVKEKTYDFATHVNQLKIAWIAKSNSEQRAGRAGRCQPGYCFRLYSADDHERMLPTQIAEMKRAAIHDVVLHAKMYAPEGVSVKRFLSLAPEPPSQEAVDSSLQFLEQLGALYRDKSESGSGGELELTDLGRHIAQLPLEPQIARLLLFGIALKCFNPAVTLVAALAYRDPFVLPPCGERSRSAALNARDDLGGFDFSDHLTLLRAFYRYGRVPAHHQSKFCDTKFLSANVMKMIAGVRRQLVYELHRLHMIPDVQNALEDPDLNRNSGSWPVIQAAIVAGSYPGIGFVKAGNKLRKIRTSTDVATLHPSCLIKRQVVAQQYRSEVINMHARGEEEPTIEYLAFQELSKIEEGLTLRTVTAVPPLAVLLFAGPIRLMKEVIKSFNLCGSAHSDNSNWDSSESEGGNNCPEGSEAGFDLEAGFELEPWLTFRGSFKELQLVLRLRFKVMSYFLEVMKNPCRCESPENLQMLSLLEQLLAADHARSKFPACKDLPIFRQRQASNKYDDRASQNGEVQSQRQRKSGNEQYDRGYNSWNGAGGFRRIPSRQCSDTRDIPRKNSGDRGRYTERSDNSETSQRSADRAETAARCGQMAETNNSTADKLTSDCTRQGSRKEDGSSNWKKRDRRLPVSEIFCNGGCRSKTDAAQFQDDHVPEDPCSTTSSCTATDKPRFERSDSGSNSTYTDSNDQEEIMHKRFYGHQCSMGGRQFMRESEMQRRRDCETRKSEGEQKYVRSDASENERSRLRQQYHRRSEEGEGKRYFEYYNSNKYPFQNRGGGRRGRRQNRGGNSS